MKENQNKEIKNKNLTFYEKVWLDMERNKKGKCEWKKQRWQVPLKKGYFLFIIQIPISYFNKWIMNNTSNWKKIKENKQQKKNQWLLDVNVLAPLLQNSVTEDFNIIMNNQIFESLFFKQFNIFFLFIRGVFYYYYFLFVLFFWILLIFTFSRVTVSLFNAEQLFGHQLLLKSKIIIIIK